MKPCPFCGSVDALDILDLSDTKRVHCGACQAWGPGPSESRLEAIARWNGGGSAARLGRDMNRLDTATCNIHILHTVDELDAWIVGTSSADVDVIKSASLADALTRLAAALGEEGE